MTITFNAEVTRFLDELEHPMRREIDLLRTIILNSDNGLTENIKWNGPNYCFNNEDRITMKIQPPKLIQLIFHRGAKKMAQPESRLITDNSDILSWKENDRAIATFRNSSDIEQAEKSLAEIINKWITAAK